tara:strand:- start:4959 stop:5321 length:363 start_codon:yes stop_codon:yes gene_type:complete
MTKIKKKTQKKPTIEIDGKLYRVHAGVRGMCEFEELSGTSVEDFMKEIDSDSKGKDNDPKGYKIDFKQVKTMAQFFYCCLKPVKHEGITFDEFYDIVDEDISIFQELENVVIKQFEEKKP